VSHNDLKTIPLFRDLKDSHLDALVKAFGKKVVKKGDVLFKSGDMPKEFLVLEKGAVEITEEGASKFLLRGPATIGELGSVTGMPRNTTATAHSEVHLCTISTDALTSFFDKHPEVAFPFYKNLLGAVSDKVRRDRRRLGETRDNLIRTQKAMKQLRELVLSSPETDLSKPVFEVLDEHIEKNRRVHYRVSPTQSYTAEVRLDDGARLSVVEVSDGYLKLAGKADRLTKDRSYWAGVLTLPTGEILVSGSIEREAKDGVVVKLDTLVDEHKQKLDDYTTQLQLLDYVV
jgi:CRP-like cAMP-binding protein